MLRELRELRELAPDFARDGGESYFNAEQNAIVARNAELYYRTMVRGGPASWNVRDRHMVETLDRLMRHHGPDANAIVWEHNTHVGDARFTDMDADRSGPQRPFQAGDTGRHRFRRTEAARRRSTLVCDPGHERWGRYVPTITSRRYDAFVFVEETRAVDPLHMAIRVDGDMPKTSPSGM